MLDLMRSLPIRLSKIDITSFATQKWGLTRIINGEMNMFLGSSSGNMRQHIGFIGEPKMMILESQLNRQLRIQYETWGPGGTP